MLFNFYLFGNPEGTHSQYPDDYSAGFFDQWLPQLSSALMVIRREDSLVHYTFIERMEDNRYIGMGLMFNDAYLQRPKALAELLHKLLAEDMPRRGNVVRYDSYGKLDFAVSHVSDAVDAYRQMQERLDNEFTRHADTYGFSSLHTPFDGTKTTGYADNSATDKEICALTREHNTVFVDLSDTLNAGYIERTMHTLRTTNLSLTREVDELRSDIAQLERKKKQFTYVIVLFGLLLLASGFLFVLHSDLNETRNSLSDANSTIVQQDDTLTSLRKTLKQEKDNHRQTKEQLEDVKAEAEQAKQTLDKTRQELSTLQRQYKQTEEEREYYFRYWLTH